MIRESGVERLYVGGLATDYCVRASALEALKRGFDVALLTDAVRAVDLESGDGERAIEEMREAGVHLTTTKRAEAEIAVAAGVEPPGSSP